MQYNILHQKAGWGANAFLDLGLAVRADNVERAIRENAPDILVLAERHDEWAGIPVPYSETSVDLSLRLDDLYRFAEDRIEDGATVRFVNADCKTVSEAGEFEVFVGYADAPKIKAHFWLK